MNKKNCAVLHTSVGIAFCLAVSSGCVSAPGIDTVIPPISPTSGGTTNPPTTVPTPSPTAPAPTPTVTPAPSPMPSAQPTALVYSGPGVLTGPDDTLIRAEFVAAQAGFNVVEVDGPVDPAVLNSASVWIQPGGPNLSADKFMNGNGMADQVRDFVNRGGGFVGFCGGAFSAMNNLGLIPGSAWNLDQATGWVPVNWLGTTKLIYFEDGPYIELSDNSAEVIGTYANGWTAVVRSHYGKGAVWISGVHEEANQDWATSPDPDGSMVYLAVQMIQTVAAVPAPPTTTSGQ